MADHIFFNFFGNKFNMCINDLQGSHEGYAQKIALKKRDKSNYKWHNAMQFVYYRSSFREDEVTQHTQIERFSYDLEMKAREQNRNDKRTEIERFDWFIERTDKRA